MYLRRLMALLMAAALLLSACSKSSVEPDEQKEQPPPDQGGGVVTIRLLIRNSRDQQLDAIINAFQEQHPQYRVAKEIYGGDMLDLERLLTEGAVDVVLGLINQVSHDLFVPLDAWVQRDRIDLAPYGEILNVFRRDGRLYTMPVEVSPRVIFYNKEMFAEAGVDEPHPDWTWEEFRQLAARLTTGEGEEKRWGAATSFPKDFVMLMLNQRTGLTPGTADEASLREALGFFAHMVVTDGSLKPGEDLPYRQLTTVFASGDAFREKQAALYLRNGVWGADSQYTRQDIKWGVVPIPSLPGGRRIAPAYATSYGISAASPNQEAAWAFLKFYAGPEGAAIMARGGRLPGYSGPAARDAWFEQLPTPDPSTEALFAIPWTPDPLVGWTTADEVLAGQRDWEEALAEYLVERATRR